MSKVVVNGMIMLVSFVFVIISGCTEIKMKIRTRVYYYNAAFGKRLKT